MDQAWVTRAGALLPLPQFPHMEDRSSPGLAMPRMNWGRGGYREGSGGTPTALSIPVGAGSRVGDRGPGLGRGVEGKNSRGGVTGEPAAARQRSLHL